MTTVYRDLVTRSVEQPLQGVRRIQTGTSTLTAGTTNIPVPSFQSPAGKVYLLTSHLDQDRNTGSQGYIATLNYNQNEIVVVVNASSYQGSISWQIIEVY